MTREEILTHIDRPYEHYVGTNALNLKNLFEKIKRENMLENKEFAETVRPVITDEIVHYFSKIYGDESPLWGAWYIEEDMDEIPWFKVKTFLNDYQRRTLAGLLQRKDAPGELIGYGLCVFAGLSVTEAMNARYRDISELTGTPEIKTLYTRGAFPKTTKATKYDGLPREIPLLNMLAEVLKKRKALISKEVTFPVTNEYGTFTCAEHLPIACEGHKYTRFSHIAGLSAYANKLLRCGLGFDELSMSHIQNTMLKEPGLYAYERSTAYYLGRRDFATMIFSADIPEKTAHYLMGHTEADEEGEARKIIDITPDNLAAAKGEYENVAAKYIQP